MQTIPRSMLATTDRQWAEQGARERHRNRALALGGRDYTRRLTLFAVRYSPNGSELDAQTIEGTADVIAATIIADSERQIDTHVFRSRADYEGTGPIVAYGRPARTSWIGEDASRFELADLLDRL